MRRFLFVVALLLVGSVLPLVPPPPAAAQEATPPQNLLVDTFTSDWTVAGPRLIWLTYPPCPEFAGSPVTISRIRTTGSHARQLFSRNDPRAPGACNPYKLNSNIVADENYVYFVDGDFLVRLPVEANPGDPPQRLSNIYFDYVPNPNSVVFSTPAQLSVTRDHVVASQSASCGFCIVGSWFHLISKADGSNVSSFIASDLANSPSFDGKHFYYKDQNNLLRRFLPGNSPQPSTIAGRVGDYVAEGETTICIPIGGQLNCTTSDYVFYIVEDTIVRYNGLNGQYQGIYTASRPISQAAKLNGLVLAHRGLSGFFGRSLFFFDKRWTPCPVPPGCFVTPATDLLRTIGRNGGTPTDLYFRNTDTAHTSQHLTSDGANIYWAEQATDGAPFPSTIKRLPADAAGLPKINLTVTGLEITQGIQRENNSVPLIQLRPTFVRVFAKAAGQSVPDVTAQLQVSADGLGTITLAPVNRDATSRVRTSRIRVLANPSRGVTNDSFLFELPWEYTRAPNLRLRATVNPFGIPLEPTLNDNTIGAGPFTFQPTPRLNVIFVEFPFRLNNTNYRPQGTLANVGWINRVYPLGASIGNEGWNHGLNYRIWDVNDAGLAARVNRQSPECDAYVKRKSDGTIEKDDREFCASDYVNGLLRDLRSRRSVPDGTFLYGEIPDTGVAGQFPRGQEGGSSVSSGPDGTAWNGFYAGHEIGHSLGLGHPKTADGSCGLQGSDPQPPHPNGWIGTADSTILGFDSSSGTVLAGASTFDMMAYCQPQWISDINYERIYKRLTGTAALLAAPRAASGDWLSVYGSLDASGSSAAVTQILRLAGELAPPPQAPGNYALRLIDAQGATLAEQRFTPEEADDGAGRQSFGLIVPFAAGTREARIVELASGTTLFSRQFSASLPTISGVALQNAADPFAGTATLGWSASDPDGDALSFDVLYSPDGGASFQPLALGLSGNSLPIDAGQLDGSSVVFRVVASDGAQGAESDSPAYTLAARPPTPRILNPADGARFEWGQLVNLRGEAPDKQDGFVAPAGLSWSNQNGPLGTGPQLALDNLPVGTNVITLTATNSAGISAATSVRLVVGDDLDEPGPSLAVEPASLSWNVAPGATQTLTAALALDNAGGGNLSWTASSDVSWLTVSPISGSVPQTLIASADPQGFAANTTARATITLQALNSSGQPFQTLSVPVAVYVGNPGYGEPPGAVVGSDVYLPLVAR